MAVTYGQGHPVHWETQKWSQQKKEASVPVYVVAQGRIENRKMLDEYVAKAVPTVEAGGGRILGFDETPEVVEGEIEHPRRVILEFPSREAFYAWYDSSDYQAILPLRLESTPGTLIVADGVPSE